MDTLTAQAWQGEASLLSPSVRSNPLLLAKWLAPDFYEIGQSGNRWHRDEIIAALPDEPAQPSDFVMTEQEAQHVAPDLVLLTYRLQFIGRNSLRSALWRRVGDSVQCCFHQGTPTA